MYETLDGFIIIHIFLVVKSEQRNFRFLFLSLNDMYLLMDNEFVWFYSFQCVKFDFLFHLESQEQSNETMIMKCTNLIQQENKNSDDDNQEDSKQKKKKKRKKNQNTCYYFKSILANEIMLKNEQNDHQHR